MEHIHDMVVIGGGPAGYTAALYATRGGLDTVLLERLSAGGQMALTGDIDNYPGFDEGIDGFTLGVRMQHGAERFGARTVNAEVTAVDFSQPVKRVVTTDGVYHARTVVIAAGADPRKLGLDGEQEFTGRGVHYCAHCDGRFYKDKIVVVVGGGNSAVADALYLSRFAKKVYVVHRRETLRADKIYCEPLLDAGNIELVWNSIVIDLITDTKLTGIWVENMKSGVVTEILCDGVFVSIGRVPSTGFLGENVALDINGYIIADESTRTSADGVFAAGDIRTKALRQIVTAAADGAIAVHYAEEYINAMGSQ